MQRAKLYLVALLVTGFYCLPADAQVDWLNNTGSPIPYYHNNAPSTNWAGGVRPTASQTARFSPGGAYEVWWNSVTQAVTPEVGGIEVTAGNSVTFLNVDVANQWEMIINGTGSLDPDALKIDGPNSELTISGIHLSNLGGTQISGGGSLTVDGSHVAGSRLTSDGLFFSVDGNVTVQSGGKLSSNLTRLGAGSGQTGMAVVTGENSQWDIGSLLTVGGQGTGSLEILSQAIVNAGDVEIGNSNSGTGDVRVAGQAILNADRIILGSGLNATGTLTIEDRGVVNSLSGTIGRGSSSVGTGGLVTIQGSNSEWNTQSLSVGQSGGVGALSIFSGGKVDVSGPAFFGVTGSGSLSIGSLAELQVSGDSFVGIDGTGTVNINGLSADNWSTGGNLIVGGDGGTGTVNLHSGQISVGNSTNIQTGSVVNVFSGRFEFGETTAEDFGRINATGGMLAGTIRFDGYNTLGDVAASMAPYDGLSKSIVGEVTLGNRGVLSGSGNLNWGLTNQATGELRTVSGQWARFGGTVSSNFGEIHNLGGTVEFESQLVNSADGFIAGRGQFIAHDGLSNSGVMALSGGPADYFGDIDNLAGGQIVSSGGVTTTFYDDVINNGEIRTSGDSRSVFFGEVSGDGNYTGTGTVYYEGDLRPGNSPGIVQYDGNVVLGSEARSLFELAGDDLGEFDRLEIAGDLSLDGLFSVELLGDFVLTNTSEFLVADVGGVLSGEFNGLGEGDLIGKFAGRDLFITYAGGDGNDVSLFTSIPEPGTASVLLMSLIGLAVCRRRRQPIRNAFLIK